MKERGSALINCGDLYLEAQFMNLATDYTDTCILN